MCNGHDIQPEHCNGLVSLWLEECMFCVDITGYLFTKGYPILK